MSLRMRRLGLITLVFAAALLARHDGGSGCATTRETPAETLFLHRQAQRARARRGMALANTAPTADRDIGNIAVMEDVGGVVEKLNQFNLDGSTLTFTPTSTAASAYRYAASLASYDATGEQGTPLVALGDDDSRQLTLPFPFTYFGVTYTTIFLNSDGNLTFVTAEAASSLRSTGRMTGGPPRISPLFDDLDPSLAPGSVRYLADATRAVFTWVAVPEYNANGLGAAQTFQVRLYPDGHIQFAWNGSNPSGAVVGIAPGNLQGPTNLVAFYTDPSAQYSSAVVERFGNTMDIDVVTLAQRFYQTHEDAYDYLFIYNNMNIGAAPGAVAYESTVRSSSTGHGIAPFDTGAEYGSPSRLQSVINMGYLTQYPVDPGAFVPARLAAQDTPITVLGHEAGHLFNAFSSVPDPANPSNKIMLGYGGSHWSYVFDSEASLDEGEQITDKGAGASPRFFTATETQGYSPLDQYLMGFRPSSAVPPVFVVTNSGLSPLGHPSLGVAFNGNRMDIAVDDVIAAVGRRTPDYTVAQRRYRFAFILVVAQGSTPLDLEIQQIDTYRQLFPAFYAKASSNNALADVTLNRSLKLSLFPAAGVMAGATATATVTVETAPAADLAIQLQTPHGFASAPVTVKIPAGATSATFTLTGLKSGVEELTATPADSTYETGFARVQVADATFARLALVSGGATAPAATVVRLTDVNGLPYPGARLDAAAAGGSVTPAFAVTDSQGQAAFHWIPGIPAINQLTLTLDSTPAVQLVLTAGSAAPVITAVVNAASYESGMSPGALGTLYGANLAGGATAQSSYPWPSTLGGVQVLLGGTALPLLYVSDGQINFYVPANARQGAGIVTVLTPGGTTGAPTFAVSVTAVQPGIFPGAIVRAGAPAGDILTTPIHAGDYIEIYCTGLGATYASNGLQLAAAIPMVFLGGIPVSPSYSGLAPGYLGLYQVDAKVPTGLAPGAQGVILSSGSAHSNEVKILVQ
jgi:uncharacterized protein (TIGR03437 family)